MLSPCAPPTRDLRQVQAHWLARLVDVRSFGLRLKLLAVKAATWIVSGASLREVDRTLGGGCQIR